MPELNAPARLAAYGLTLAVVFGIAHAAAGALVPDDVVQRWNEQVATTEHAPSHD